MSYSNYCAISHGNPVFQQMTSIWPFQVTKGQTEYDIRFTAYHFLYVCSVVTIVLSCMETLFFSTWPWSDLSRSPKVKLIMPSDSRHITSYTCSIATITLSDTETLFFSKWPWSGFSRSPKVKLNMTFNSPHIISYTCSIVFVALSRTETPFFRRWPWSDI